MWFLPEIIFIEIFHNIINEWTFKIFLDSFTYRFTDFLKSSIFLIKIFRLQVLNYKKMNNIFSTRFFANLLYLESKILFSALNLWDIYFWWHYFNQCLIFLSSWPGKMYGWLWNTTQTDGKIFEFTTRIHIQIIKLAKHFQKDSNKKKN